MSSQKLSRKQLYDLVWSKPINQLSKEFAIKDTALRKICKKYDIPLPQNGYWSKLKYGKPYEQEKLAHFDKWVNTKISIKESEAHEEEHYLTKLARRIKEIENACSLFFPVPPFLSSPHPLVRTAQLNYKGKKKALSWRKTPECIYTDSGIISISVQKHNVPRALRIMNTFVKMAEFRGHTIRVERDYSYLIIDGEKYNFRLRETHRRVTITTGRYPETQLIPIDKLTIKHDGYPRKEWIENSTPLEELLPKILAYFELQSIIDKERREYYRIQREEDDRQREIERKLKAQREWELSKQNLLVSIAKEWRQAEYLRNLISKIEEQGDSSNKTKEWLIWAKQAILEIDPLSDGVQSLISKFDIPENLQL